MPDLSELSDLSDLSDKGILSTRQGAIQLAPSRRSTSSERLAGRGYGIVFDPCGRTSRYECDRKGRRVWGAWFPPVFGSASLDWGLSEWHPVGC